VLAINDVIIVSAAVALLPGQFVDHKILGNVYRGKIVSVVPMFVEHDCCGRTYRATDMDLCRGDRLVGLPWILVLRGKSASGTIIPSKISTSARFEIEQRGVRPMVGFVVSLLA